MGMTLAKVGGRNGKLHWLPGPHAYKALCGKTDGKSFWAAMRPESEVFWSKCKRCEALVTAQSGE